MDVSANVVWFTRNIVTQKQKKTMHYNTSCIRPKYSRNNTLTLLSLLVNMHQCILYIEKNDPPVLSYVFMKSVCHEALCKSYGLITYNMLTHVESCMRKRSSLTQSEIKTNNGSYNSRFVMCKCTSWETVHQAWWFRMEWSYTMRDSHYVCLNVMVTSKWFRILLLNIYA